MLPAPFTSQQTVAPRSNRARSAYRVLRSAPEYSTCSSSAPQSSFSSHASCCSRCISCALACAANEPQAQAVRVRVESKLRSKRNLANDRPSPSWCARTCSACIRRKPTPASHLARSAVPASSAALHSASAACDSLSCACAMAHHPSRASARMQTSRVNTATYTRTHTCSHMLTHIHVSACTATRTHAHARKPTG